VVAAHPDDRPAVRVRRHPERVALALDDEDRDRHRVQLREPALLGPARRMDREGEAEDGDRARLAGRPARDAGAERAAAVDQRELAHTQLVHHGDPGRIELGRRSRSATPRDAVGLLDERDGDPFGQRGLGRRDEVGRAHSSPGAVPEDEQRARILRLVQVHAGGAVWSLDLSCHGFA